MSWTCRTARRAPWNNKENRNGRSREGAGGVGGGKSTVEKESHSVPSRRELLPVMSLLTDDRRSSIAGHVRVHVSA